jgi:protein SCO1
MRKAGRVLVLLLCPAIFAACAGTAGAPDFTLRDDGGSRWTLAAQRGKVVLLTFGFTHCADTCPATLAKLTRLTSSIPGGAQKVEVAFVTIDPTRDTVAVMHRFIARFAQPGEGDLVGLTGTAPEIESVKAAYHIWSQPTPHDIAHTAVIFLIDPYGRIRGVRNDDDSETSLSRAVAEMFASS